MQISNDDNLLDMILDTNCNITDVNIATPSITGEPPEVVASNDTEADVNTFDNAINLDQSSGDTKPIAPPVGNIETGLKNSKYPFDSSECESLSADRVVNNPKYSKELIKDSAIATDLISLNIFTCDRSEYWSEHILHFKKKINKGGTAFLFSGVNVDDSADPFVQVKPHKTIKYTVIEGDEEIEKEFPKYLTPKSDDECDDFDSQEFPADPQEKLHSANRPGLPRISIQSFEKMKENFKGLFDDYFLVTTAQGECLGLWQYIQDHPEIPIVIAEGYKKALSVLSLGFPAFHIRGCFMCQILPNLGKSNHRLGPWWKLWVQKGKRTWYVAFDGDNANNPNVAKALFLLVFLLGKANQKAVILNWDVTQKGLDDYLASKNDCDRLPAFKKILETAETLDQWSEFHNLRNNIDIWKGRELKPKPKDSDTDDKCPTAQELADILYFERYQHSMKYFTESRRWLGYGLCHNHIAEAKESHELCQGRLSAKPKGKAWFAIKEYWFKKEIILGWLDVKGYKSPNKSYCDDVIAHLKDRCAVLAIELDLSQGYKRYFSFNDGIFDTHANKLKPHNPKYLTLSYHPWDYEPVIRDPKQSLEEFWLEQLEMSDLAPLGEYLKRSQSADGMEPDKQEILRLIATMKAYKFQWLCEFHMFVLITGKAGTGKTTFMHLLAMLFDPNYGKGNPSNLVAQMTLKNIEKDPPSLLAIASRPCLHIGEANSKSMNGDAQDLLKLLAEGEQISGRLLYSNELSDFLYTGNVVIAANKPPIGLANAEGGISRRQLSFSFENQLKKGEFKTGYEFETFPPIIKHLLNRLLPAENMTKTETRQILELEPSESIKAIKRAGVAGVESEWLTGFVNDCLEICDPKEDQYLTADDLMGAVLTYRPGCSYTNKENLSKDVATILEHFFTDFGWDVAKRLRSTETYKVFRKQNIKAGFRHLKIKETESVQPNYEDLQAMYEMGLIDKETKVYKLDMDRINKLAKRFDDSKPAEVVSTEPAKEPELVLPESAPAPIATAEIVEVVEVAEPIKEPAEVLPSEPKITSEVLATPQPEPIVTKEKETMTQAIALLEQNCQTIPEAEQYWKQKLDSIWKLDTDFFDDPDTMPIYVPKVLHSVGQTTYTPPQKTGKPDLFPEKYPALSEAIEANNQARIKTLVMTILSENNWTFKEFKKQVKSITPYHGKYLNPMLKLFK